MGCKQVSEGTRKNGEPKQTQDPATVGNPPTVITKLKVIFLRNGAIIHSIEEVPGNTKVKEVKEAFFANFHQYSPMHSFTFYTENKKELIHPETEINAYVTSNTKVLSLDVEMTGLDDFPLDSEKVIQHTLLFMAKPIEGITELVIFDTKTSKISVEEIPENVRKTTEIELYSNRSAYCNGKNYLFVSGGDNNDGSVILGHFWIFDLMNRKIEKHNQGLPSPKKHHSMIFIPNKYVFIAGGNTKDVYYYDTTKKKFLDWGKLNQDRIEPALVLINNCELYAFTGGKGSHQQYSFEKTNLRGLSKWELVTPNIPGGCDFTQTFFAACFHKKDQIIFLGGFNQDIEGKEGNQCFEYNYNTKVLQPAKQKFEEIEFAEKFFLPIDDNFNSLIPNISKKNLGKLQILSYAKDKEVLEKIQYVPDLESKPIEEHFMSTSDIVFAPPKNSTKAISNSLFAENSNLASTIIVTPSQVNVPVSGGGK